MHPKTFSIHISKEISRWLMAQPSYRLVKTRLTGMSAKCFLEVRPLSHDAGYMLAINVKFAPIGALPPWRVVPRITRDMARKCQCSR